MTDASEDISAATMAEFGIPARLRPAGMQEAIDVTVMRLENVREVDGFRIQPSPSRQTLPAEVALRRADYPADPSHSVLEILSGPYAGTYDITHVQARMAGLEWCLSLCMQRAHP